jgi:hypothetical protein
MQSIAAESYFTKCSRQTAHRYLVPVGRNKQGVLGVFTGKWTDQATRVSGFIVHRGQATTSRRARLIGDVCNYFTGAALMPMLP